MLSQNEKSKIGLTFSLNDVNLDSNSLNLVPILLNTPEKEEVEIASISKFNLFNMELPKVEPIDLSYSYNEEPSENYLHSDILIEEKSNTSPYYENPYTTEQTNHYEPVKHHWFYCAIINGLAEWKPFSKTDSSRIEMRYLETCDTGLHFQDSVPTDGSRYDVFLEQRQKVPVYWDEAPMEIRRCSWFYRPEEQALLLPYSERESDLLEQTYRRVFERDLWNQPLEPFGTSIDPRVLEDRFVFHSAHTMVEYRRYREDPAANRQGRIVYRGLDGLSALGIPEGDSDTIEHVVFVLTAGGSPAGHERHAVECAANLRQTVSAMRDYHFRERRARIEVLPVPWRFPTRSHDLSTVAKITGKTVRKLRHFTNEIVLQLLGYMNDGSREGVLIELARQMNRLRHQFSSRHPQYDGPVSIAAHGIASMAFYDLVSLQDDRSGLDQSFPSESSRSAFRLEFEVGHLFALGSPIALLLVLLHPTATAHRECTSSLIDCLEWRHARGSLFNIFHPLDPLGYRLEPLVLERGAEQSPVVVPHYKGGRKRLHLELKDNLMRVGSDLKTRLVDTLKSTWSTLHEFAASHKTEIESDERQMLLEDGREMMRALDTLDRDEAESESVSSRNESPDMGRINRGRRLDYVLQSSVLESLNDSVCAVDSHGCYWTSEDSALLMLREIYRDSAVPSLVGAPPGTATASRRTDHVARGTLPPAYLSAMLPPRIGASSALVPPPTFQHVSTANSFFLPTTEIATAITIAAAPAPESNFDNGFDFGAIESKPAVNDQSSALSKHRERDTLTTHEAVSLPPRTNQYFSTPPVPPPPAVSYPGDSSGPPSNKALSSSSWSPVGSSLRGDGDSGDVTTTLTGDSVHIEHEQPELPWTRGDEGDEHERERDGSSFDDSSSWHLNGRDMISMSPFELCTSGSHGDGIGGGDNDDDDDDMASGGPPAHHLALGSQSMGSLFTGGGGPTPAPAPAPAITTGNSSDASGALSMSMMHQHQHQHQHQQHGLSRYVAPAQSILQTPAPPPLPMTMQSPYLVSVFQPQRDDVNIDYVATSWSTVAMTTVTSTSIRDNDVITAVAHPPPPISLPWQPASPSDSASAGVSPVSCWSAMTTTPITTAVAHPPPISLPWQPASLSAHDNITTTTSSASASATIDLVCAPPPALGARVTAPMVSMATAMSMTPPPFYHRHQQQQQWAPPPIPMNPTISAAMATGTGSTRISTNSASGMFVPTGDPAGAVSGELAASIFDTCSTTKMDSMATNTGIIATAAPEALLEQDRSSGRAMFHSPIVSPQQPPSIRSPGPLLGPHRSPQIGHTGHQAARGHPPHSPRLIGAVASSNQMVTGPGTRACSPLAVSAMFAGAGGGGGVASSRPALTPRSGKLFVRK